MQKREGCGGLELARHILLEKFDIIDTGIYRNGFNQFIVHDFNSTMEYIVMRRAEIQAEYEMQKKKETNNF